MPKIAFKKGFKEIEVPAGANLMAALLKAGRPVASSCHGDGVCAKCRIEVVSGFQNLSSPTKTEEFLIEKEGLPQNYRISCQVKVFGDIEIDTTYW